ncbi:MAG: hypothetical protein F9K18_15245, partial [Thermoanaerobaculia bacterium]
MTEPTLTLELGRARSGFVQRIADEGVWSTLALDPEALPVLEADAAVAPGVALDAYPVFPALDLARGGDHLVPGASAAGRRQRGAGQ